MKKTMGRSLLVCTAVMLLSGCKSGDYKQAQKFYDDGDYQSAYEIFEELGDYKDSEILADECLKEAAHELYECSDYYGAYECYKKLGYDKDCAVMVNEIAKLLYTNTATYAVKCEIADNSLPEQICKVDMSLSSEKDTFEGNGKELSDFIHYAMPEVSGGYALIEVNRAGVPEQCWFCSDDCFGEGYENGFDIADVGSEYLIGGYPSEAGEGE